MFDSCERARPPAQYLVAYKINCTSPIHARNLTFNLLLSFVPKHKLLSAHYLTTIYIYQTAFTRRSRPVM